MFRKFDEKESVSGVAQLKTSVQKNIRAQVPEFLLKKLARSCCDLTLSIYYLPIYDSFFKVIEIRIRYKKMVIKDNKFDQELI